MTSRAPAQVRRLSLLYALLDKSPNIKAQHLLAGLAVWDYCEASVFYLYPRAGKSDQEIKVLQAIQEAGSLGCRRSDITKSLNNHIKKDALTEALTKLVRQGHILEQRVPVEGGAVSGRMVSRFSVRPVPTVDQFLEKYANVCEISEAIGPEPSLSEAIEGVL